MSLWHDSVVEESQLEDFAVKGLLPSRQVAGWRVPPPDHEVPQPEPHERASFLTFHERGLRYPAHWFLRRLLNEWGLELQHLNPNRVVHIAGFVTLCEVFLRIEPHVDLFRAFFHRKISPVTGESSPAHVGGFGLQRRPLQGEDYSEYTPVNTNRGWHDEWFYIRNPVDAPFPKFSG